MIIEDTITSLEPTMRAERHCQHSENDSSVAAGAMEIVDQRKRARQTIVARPERCARSQQWGRNHTWIAT